MGVGLTIVDSIDTMYIMGLQHGMSSLFCILPDFMISFFCLGSHTYFLMFLKKLFGDTWFIFGFMTSVFCLDVMHENFD